MPKILVTGSNGLVGSAIKKLNIPDAVYITHDDPDLTDTKAVIAKFLEIKPTKIIHTAAQVGGIGGNTKHPGLYFYNNMMINTNVLEAARLAGVEKLISFLSTCIFPDKCTYPLNEKDLHNGEPHPSNFGYAYAKRMIEVQSRAYRKEYELNFITAIPTNIYGPNDNFSLENGHVLPALIHRTYLAKKNDEDLVVWGSGTPLREFVFSEDIANLAVWALESYNEEAPIIFSSGKETSIKELVELIAKKLDFTGRIIFDDSKPDGQFRKPSDTAKLKKLNPDFKFTGIEKGLDETITWFMENYKAARK